MTKQSNCDQMLTPKHHILRDVGSHSNAVLAVLSERIGALSPGLFFVFSSIHDMVVLAIRRQFQQSVGEKCEFHRDGKCLVVYPFDDQFVS